MSFSPAPSLSSLPIPLMTAAESQGFRYALEYFRGARSHMQKEARAVVARPIDPMGRGAMQQITNAVMLQYCGGVIEALAAHAERNLSPRLN